MTTEQSSDENTTARDSTEAKPTFTNYNNEAYDSSGDKPKPVLNGFPIGIVKAKTAVKKWGKYSRSKREFEGIVYPPVLDKDQDEIKNKELSQEDHANQKKLNYKLLKHFVELANPEEVNEEVDFELIESLLKEGANVNCTDKYGQTLLHEAARTWHTDVARFLLGQGADINKTDYFGRTALHVAAATNYPEMVGLLYDKGAKLEARTTNELQTPLHFAARNDATDSLRAMIKLGADRECRDYRERTPLFVAAELDRSDTARFLVDVNADATVIDDAGQSCMTHMITNMGPVARQALDQFHRKDRANRKQYFFLNLLEPKMIQDKKKYQEDSGEEGRHSSLAKTPLEVIVNYKQLDLIMHPVITRLIDVKWKLFGRRRAWRALIVNLLFVLVWTILGVAVPWQTRRVYTFPQDWWRVILLVIGCAFTIYFIAYEVIEIVRSRDNFQTWKAWREEQIKRDLEHCHPKWPEEKKYLDREIECLDDLLPNYFRDFWNYFDWTVYSLIVIVVITHAIDTGVFVASPCCLNDICNNTSVLICDGGGYVNNLSLSAWNNRIFVALIICLWLRIMKDTRAFRFLGPFIVMLGKIAWDVVRFFYLYMEFYIPYSCAFWMIFGNLSTISSMSTVDRMLFSLYRITLVDDYQFDEMQAYDIVMAYILVGTFLGVSAVLCINLFIALLSDTFQRVYDNANANAVMQQATLMLGHEENLSKRSRKRVRKFIEMKGSPEETYYDDDLTVAQDADLKKVTIQIKDQMDELMEHIQQAETDNRLSSMRVSVSSFDDEAQLVSGDPDNREQQPSEMRGTRRTSIGDKADDGFITPRSGRPTMKKTLSDVMALNKSNSTGNIAALPQQHSDLLGAFQRRMGDTQSLIRELKVSIAAQEQTQKRMRNDMKEIKQMLWQLAKEKAVGGVAAMVEEEQQRTGAVPGRREDPSQSMDPAERARFLSRFVAPVAESAKSNRPSSSSGLPAVEMVPLPGSMPRGQSSSNISQPITVDVTVHGGDPERQNTSDA